MTARDILFPQLFDEKQIRMMRELVTNAPGEIDLVDFDEMIALPEIRKRTRLWYTNQNKLAAFAFVDLFDNMVYVLSSEIALDDMGSEILFWCEDLSRKIAGERKEAPLLDAVCETHDHSKRLFLLQNGFVEQPVRSLTYFNNLDDEVRLPLIPAGYHLRCVKGEDEAGALAELHRDCFGTDIMTVEYRLAMMRTAVYDLSLDLVFEAENGDLVAFCVCSLEESRDEHDCLVGHPDPIGVRPGYRQLGLGKAILVSGLHKLQERGAKSARLGTSSENIPMQKLAKATGFRLISEKQWFRKEVKQ